MQDKDLKQAEQEIAELTKGLPDLAPEPTEAAPQQRPGSVKEQPQPQPRMPETISLPTAQFIKMQQELGALKAMMALPKLSENARTQNVSTKKCAALGSPGHNIQAMVIRQTQQVSQKEWVEFVQTMIMCVHCGAALDQIRAEVPEAKTPAVAPNAVTE